MLQTMMKFFRPILRAALEVFRPPPDATSWMVRKSGALGLVLGLVLFVGSIGLAVALDRLGLDMTKVPDRLRGILQLVLLFPSLSFMVVGGFRLIAGREPENSSPFTRVALGVLGGVFGLFTLIAAWIVVILVSWALQH
jgi:hypothetical protein